MADCRYDLCQFKKAPIVVEHDNSLGSIKRGLLSHAASCDAQAGLT
jgi:hypothetical protein